MTSKRIEWLRPEVAVEIQGVRGALAFAAVVLKMAEKCCGITWRLRKTRRIFLVAPRYRVKVIRRA